MTDIVTTEGGVLFLAGVGTRDIDTVSGNPWHDPRTGKFANAPPGMRVLRGLKHLADIPNGSKRAIESRRKATGPDAMVVDPMPDGQTRVIFFKGTRQVDAFYVPTGDGKQPAAAAGAPSPVGRAEQMQLPLDRDYYGLPELSAVESQALPPMQREIYRSFREQIAKLQQSNKETPNPVYEHQIEEGKLVLGYIRDEADAIRRTLDTDYSDDLALKTLVDRQFSRFPHEMYREHLTSIYDADVQGLSVEVQDERVRTAFLNLMDGTVRRYNMDHGFSGEVNWEPGVGYNAIAHHNGDVGIAERAKYEFVSLSREFGRGALTPNGFHMLNLIEHEAGHLVQQKHVRELQARLDYRTPLGAYVEEGMTEHQARYRTERMLDHAGVVSIENPLAFGLDPDVWAYQDEFEWARGVQLDLAAGIRDRYNISEASSEIVAAAHMKNVHASTSNPYSRLRALDILLARHGKDMRKHAEKLPGVGRHNEAEWRVPDSDRPRYESRVKVAPLDFVPGEGFNPKRFPTKDHATVWALDHYENEWLPELNDVEKASIYGYTHDAYEDINLYLRQPDALGTQSYHMREESVQAYIADMDAALAKAKVPDDVTVYRGIIHAEMRANPDAYVGRVIHDPGFASTSLDKDRAIGFTGHSNGVILKIDLPAGSRAGFVDPLTTMDEKEMLLPRGTDFHIYAVEGLESKPMATKPSVPVLRARVVRQATHDPVELAEAFDQQKAAASAIPGQAVQFPTKFSQKWLDSNVAGLTDQEWKELQVELAKRGWEAEEMSQRVVPSRMKGLAELHKDKNPVAATVKDLEIGDVVINHRNEVVHIVEGASGGKTGEGEDGKHVNLYNSWNFYNVPTFLKISQPAKIPDTQEDASYNDKETGNILPGYQDADALEMVSPLKKLQNAIDEGVPFIQEINHKPELLDDADDIGPAGGTTGARWWRKADGTKYVVKSGTRDRLASEMLANGVYRELGVPVANSAWTLGHDDEEVIAHEEIKGHNLSGLTEKQGAFVDLRRHMMVDAFVGNWDVVGTGYDNIILGDDDNAYRVDLGGTFEFRAQGGKKEFSGVPSEHESLMDPDVNWYSYNAFAGLEVDQKAQQAGHIADTMTDAMIDSLVDTAGFHDLAMRDRIRKSLKQRRDWMRAFAEDNGVYSQVEEDYGLGPKIGDLKPSDKFYNPTTGELMIVYDVGPNITYAHFESDPGAQVTYHSGQNVLTPDAGPEAPISEAPVSPGEPTFPLSTIPFSNHVKYQGKIYKKGSLFTHGDGTSTINLWPLGQEIGVGKSIEVPHNTPVQYMGEDYVPSDLGPEAAVPGTYMKLKDMPEGTVFKLTHSSGEYTVKTPAYDGGPNGSGDIVVVNDDGVEQTIPENLLDSSYEVIKAGSAPKLPVEDYFTPVSQLQPGTQFKDPTTQVTMTVSQVFPTQVVATSPSGADNYYNSKQLVKPIEASNAKYDLKVGDTVEFGKVPIGTKMGNPANPQDEQAVVVGGAEGPDGDVIIEWTTGGESTMKYSDTGLIMELPPELHPAKTETPPDQKEKMSAGFVPIGSTVEYMGKEWKVIGVNGLGYITLEDADGNKIQVFHLDPLDVTSKGGGKQAYDELPDTYEYPPKFIKSWVQYHVPKMTPTQYKNLKQKLYSKGWDDGEIEKKVAPYYSANDAPVKKEPFKAGIKTLQAGDVFVHTDGQKYAVVKSSNGSGPTFVMGIDAYNKLGNKDFGMVDDPSIFGAVKVNNSKPVSVVDGPSMKAHQTGHVAGTYNDPSAGATAFQTYNAGESWAMKKLAGLQQRVTTNWSYVKNAFYSYFDGVYTEINNALRGKHGSSIATAPSHIKQHVQNMDNGFEVQKPIDENVVIYRSTNWPVDITKGDALIGSFIRDKGFMSSTWTYDKASGWPGYTAKIIVPAGFKLVWANDASMSPHSHEKEVLLPRNTIVQVVGIEQKGYQKMLILKVVHQGTGWNTPQGGTLYGSEQRELVNA